MKDNAMKKFRLVLLGMITGILLSAVFLWAGSLRNAGAASPRAAGTATATRVDEAAASDNPLAAPGGDEIPPTDNPRLQSVNVLPTSIPGESLVYFLPTDNDASATVIFLYNTDSIDHTVALRGYSYSGILVYSLNINVPATSILRLASDSIAAAPPPSWATPAPLITNFTDFTYLASLSLPKGVKAEGYTLFNPGTGVVGPRLDQGAIPLRFSSDPASIFLPSVQTGP
jgi:hypothetical protein